MSALVYALVHRRRGLVYVGSTRNMHTRMKYWRAILADEIRHPEGFPEARVGYPPVAIAARGTSLDDWSFEVWARLPRDCSEADLWEAEAGFICQAREYCGPDCLNSGGLPRRGAYVSGQWPRRSL